MPTVPNYDYRCDNCGYTEQVRHSFTEDYNGDICYTFDGDVYDETSCPGSMQRVFQATPAIFRGNGWGKMVTYKPKKG